MPSTIQDYAIIGDGRSCALVAKTGSIDFLCWPTFDSDACLTALLGDERYGYWVISPASYVSRTLRRYRTDTAILETEHVTDTGRVRVTDLMPWRHGPSSIIRIVEALEGKVPMAMALRLRFGYGQIEPWRERDERGLIFEIGPDRVVLDCPVHLTMEGDVANARFMLAKGAKVAFVLRYSPSTATPPSPLNVDAEIDATENEWKGWISRYRAEGRWEGLFAGR